MKSKLKQLSNKTSPFINYPNFQVSAKEQEDSSIDWNADNPHTSFTLYIPSSEHISSPHISLPQDGSSGSNISETSSFNQSLFNYSNGQPSDVSFWDRAFQAVFLFGTKEASSTDVTNIHKSLVRIGNYIKNCPTSKKTPSRDFIPIIKSFWELFDVIFVLKWDVLLFDREKALTIRKYVGTNFASLFRENTTLSSLKPTVKNLKEKSSSLASTPATSSAPLPSPSMVIPPINKNNESINKKESKPSNIRKSYTQVSKLNVLPNIENILQIKDAFLSLSAGEVDKIMKSTNSSKRKKKLSINITTRRPSRKQVIVPIVKSNAELIVQSAYQYIINTNNCLRNIKSDVIVDFLQVWIDGINITMSKPANPSDLTTIKKYIKNINNISLYLIESSRFPKSKSYLKIIGLLYSMGNDIITPDFIKGVLKEIHLFKDVLLALKPWIIKASPKSNIAMVWVNIWDSQSSSSAKNIINCCFNIGHFIATI